LLNNYPAIPGTFVTSTLKLVNKHKYTIDSERIPRTFRTLMKTPRGGNTLVTAVDEKTSFYYFSIENTLKKYAIFLKNETHIKMSIFIDGVEGDKSTGLVYWPILGKILEIEVNIIFPIALHTGYSKPTCLEIPSRLR